MTRPDADLDRLLRSAAKAVEPSTLEAPYGFETRVIALWRAGNGGRDDTAEVARFLRRIAAVAITVLVVASVSAYRQFNENEARITPQANEYAIADSAIQTEFSQ